MAWVFSKSHRRPTSFKDNCMAEIPLASIKKNTVVENEKEIFGFLTFYRKVTGL